MAGAELLYRRALEGLEKVLGQDHPHTLICLNNLAILLKRDHRLREAVQLLREVSGLSASALAAVRYNLSCFECLSGNRDEACRLIKQEIAANPVTRETALQDIDLRAIHDFIAMN